MAEKLEGTVLKTSTTAKVVGSTTAASTVGIILAWIWAGFAVPAGLPVMTPEVSIAFAALISAVIAHWVSHVKKPPEG